MSQSTARRTRCARRGSGASCYADDDEDDDDDDDDGDVTLVIHA